MKRFLSTLVLLLSLYQVTSAANTFYLQCNKVFSEGEEVRVNFSQYYGYRNFPTEVEMALYRVNDPETFFAAGILQNYQSSVPDSIMREQTLVKHWSQSVNRSYNQVIPVGKLKPGLYVLESIGNGEASQIPVVVSNYGIISRNTGNEMLAYVTHRQDGRALKGFKAIAVVNNEVIKSEAKSSIARFKVKMSSNYYSYVPVVAYANGEVTVSQSYFYNYYYGQQQSPVKTFVVTDRSAYRPGQKMYFKGTFREMDKFEYTIPTDSAVFKITDPNGKEILTKKVKLDQHGAYDDSLDLSINATLGEYKINAYLNGMSANQNLWWWYAQQPAQGTFRIEEYKKPEFEVNVSLDKQQYTKGDDMKVEIDAKYLFGAAVINGDVEYKILRQTHDVPWYYYHPWYYWYRDYYRVNNNDEVIQTGTGKLSWNGKFYVTVPTKKGEDRNYKYTVIANVTDASRRQISGTKTTIVAHTAFNLSAFADKYYFNDDEPLRVHVDAKDFSSSPVSTRVKATLYNYYRGNNNPIETVWVETNPKTGRGTIEFRPKNSGYFRVELESEDDRKRKVATSCYGYVINPKDNGWYWWQKSAGSIQIMTDKKVYEAGETIQAQVYIPHEADAMISINNQQIAFYDVYAFDGNSEDAEGARALQFRLPESAFGKLDVNVSYMYNNQYYTHKEQLTVVPTQSYLNVELKFDQDQYRPGNLATARLLVTDKAGNPVPNANVTLSTVDEAIFSLYADETKNIQEVFYGNEAYNDYNQYQNYFNAYSYSREVPASGMIWRRKRMGSLAQQSYLPQREWTRYFHTLSSDGSFISGFVVDHATGDPIPGATVQVGKRKFSTDKYGYYAISNVKTSHISIDFSFNNITTTVEHVPVQKNAETTLMVAISSSRNKRITAVASPTIMDLEDMVEITEEEAQELNNEVTTLSATSTGSFGYADGAVGGAVSLDSDMSAMTVSAERKSKAGRSQMNKMQESAERLDKTDLRPKKEFKEATVRSDFQDVIYWNPNVTTNWYGEAKVKIRLPDNLTTWRTTARVISQDTKVGQTIAKVVVTKNLLVRMETPRFMTVGDEMLIATNVHNYLETEKAVKVRLRANGVTAKGTEQIITVPAHGEQSIDWPIEANWITDASFTIEALTDEESDAMVVNVPVLPYGLLMLEANSMYLSNSTTKAMSLEVPAGIDLNTVSMEVSTAPSITSALLASMDDLIGYPYGCVEQTMSRFLPNVIVANTLEDVESSYYSGIDKDELAKMTAQGLKRLKELQHSDGGWGWWENDATQAVMTAYVTNGVHLAKTAGYDVDGTLYNNALSKLRQHVVQRDGDETTQAYSMVVAMRCGMTDLWEKYGKKNAKTNNPYGMALWLQASVLADDQDAVKYYLKRLEENAIEEGTRVYWGGQKYYYGWQEDQVETTANVVQALSMVDLEHPMLHGAVQWLMSKRQGVSWYNTRQTAMTIYGLNEIIKSELNPELDLEIYVNGILMDQMHVDKDDVMAKGHLLQLKGETYMVSLGGLALNGKHNIVRRGKNTIKVVTKGKGGLYVNAKLRYFLDDEKSLELDQNKRGFEVVRTYYKLEKHIAGDGKLTYKKKKVDPKDIASGDDILVKVSVIANGNQDYVLIEDPIPAGCEFVRNTQGYIIPGEAEYDGVYDYWNDRRWGYWNWNRWYAHREYRDSKLAMTVTHMLSGTYQYSYILKAQIPGKFKVTPAVAQLMYYPEVRGFSDFFELEIKE